MTDLVAATGATQANVSKHLTLLHRLAFVARRKEGTHVFYRVADPDCLLLCDLVCGAGRGRTTPPRRREGVGGCAGRQGDGASLKQAR